MADETEAEGSPVTKRTKGIYIGAPACFALDLTCMHINEAFGFGGHCYVVGSALERPDWRDIDVRLILPDDEFKVLFPNTYEDGHSIWEGNPRWLLLTVSISAWLQQQTGLPVDFQIQPQTHANDRHKKPRNAVGMKTTFRKNEEE